MRWRRCHAACDGSLALGATRAETVTGVLIPAAIPGIVGGVLLAVSRAVGETMIVVMAAAQQIGAAPCDRQCGGRWRDGGHGGAPQS